MKTQITSTFLYSTILIIAALAQTGCQGPRPDLTITKNLTVDLPPAEKTKVVWTQLYEEGNDTVIRAAVKRRNLSTYPMKTYLDIIVFDPDGKEIIHTQTDEKYIPRKLPKRQNVNIRVFKTTIPQTIPENSTVTIISGRPQDEPFPQAAPAPASRCPCSQ